MSVAINNLVQKQIRLFEDYKSFKSRMEEFRRIKRKMTPAGNLYYHSEYYKNSYMMRKCANDINAIQNKINELRSKCYDTYINNDQPQRLLDVHQYAEIYRGSQFTHTARFQNLHC